MGDILGGRVELLGYTKADLCNTGDLDADLRTMGDFDTDLTRMGPLGRDLVETKLTGGLGVRRRLSLEALYLERSFLLNPYKKNHRPAILVVTIVLAPQRLP